MTVNTHLKERFEFACYHAWTIQDRGWIVGNRGREAMVTPLGSRIRVANKDEGTRKPEGDVRISKRGTDQTERL